MLIDHPVQYFTEWFGEYFTKWHFTILICVIQFLSSQAGPVQSHTMLCLDVGVPLDGWLSAKYEDMRILASVMHSGWCRNQEFLWRLVKRCCEVFSDVRIVLDAQLLIFLFLLKSTLGWPFFGWLKNRRWWCWCVHRNGHRIDIDSTQALRHRGCNTWDSWERFDCGRCRTVARSSDIMFGDMCQKTATPTFST